jgi:hypothetical protein
MNNFQTPLLAFLAKFQTRLKYFSRFLLFYIGSRVDQCEVKHQESTSIQPPIRSKTIRAVFPQTLVLIRAILLRIEC